MKRLWKIYGSPFFTIIVAAVSLSLVLAGCDRTGEGTRTGSGAAEGAASSNTDTDTEASGGQEDAPADGGEDYTLETKVMDVINDPVFEGYGRLIFPVDQVIDEDLELQDVGSILTWYNNVNPERTVEIVNYLKDQVSAGNQIFYDIYTEEEKQEDPEKENTGLFFFRGNPGAKTAIVNAGGGFVYVAAMHDSFPQALELSQMGYNGFALIYRPGADTACQDLARAIAFLHENAEELQVIPEEYRTPAQHQGTLNRLTYETWESFIYEEHSQRLTKEAWVYLPYGYSEEQRYNVFYISHGGWSDETTVMGTDQNPTYFKNVIDHAIEDGKMQPMILVLPTYNNTSESDSGKYSLALRLTDQFHNELVNDLIPAVESRYSTYAEDTTPEGLRASRDHRGFGGFSMGSVNTWCTFRYCLDYFRYFMPMSGSYTTDGDYMAELVSEQGYGPEDFFIFAASGTDDFAYSAFRQQIEAMGNASAGMFRFGSSEAEGNLAFLVREGYVHDSAASYEYTYNGLCFFWNGAGSGHA